MLQKDNRCRVLEQFFFLPTTQLQLRELSRKAKLAPPSVKRYLREFEKEGLVLREKHRLQGYPVYRANRESERFATLKKLDTVRRLYESGLVEDLFKKFMPDAIILFGSASMGEDMEGSDIDLFLQCDPEDFRLERYQRLFFRRITPFFRKDFGKSSAELKNNLINGIVLKGYLKAF